MTEVAINNQIDSFQREDCYHTAKAVPMRNVGNNIPIDRNATDSMEDFFKIQLIWATK
jgi:hypothetical protein